MKTSPLLFFFLILPFFAVAQEVLPLGGKDTTVVRKDTVVPQTFEFVQRGDRALFLDVYKPVQSRRDSACVAYLFGGGFVEGERNNEGTRAVCQALVRSGYTVVAIDYRLHIKEVNFDTVSLLGTQRVFRDAINMAAEDAAAAVGYVCRHAGEWGVSEKRIVLVGSSAGAIGALQLDYCRANALPPAAELPKEFVPAAVVAYSGAIYAEGGKPRYKTPPAPTFFLHGTEDRIVNYKKFPPILRNGLYGPKKLQRIFRRNNYPHWIFRFEGIGHEVATLPIYMIPEFNAFVNATLGGRLMFYDCTVRDSRVQPTKWSKMGVFDLYRR